MIQSLALMVASFALSQAPMLEKPFVDSHYLYNGVDRPLWVTITSPRSFGPTALAVMNHEGTLLAEIAQVNTGDVDLVELFPEIWAIREICYVQLLKRGEPAGASLVLQPMLSRMVPVTIQAPHPTYGGTHTKIVGFRDEFAPPPQVVNEDTKVGGSVREMREIPDATDAQVEPTAHERFFTGFRAYVESDVLLRTTLGNIRLAMRPDHAPNTVWNFLQLVKGGFYRDIIFHRIVPLTSDGDPFVIQTGDPTALGDGGPGYWLPMEPSLLEHDFGVISMARDDNPDTAGSQIFICLSRKGTARLDVQYCSFGYAVEGAETILAISQVQLADVAAGRPADPPVIRVADLTPAPARTPGVGRPDQRVTKKAPPKKPRRVPR